MTKLQDEQTYCLAATGRPMSSLFRACDLDGSGYIDQSELAVICSELTNEEIREVFGHLDKDGDGKISVDEFSKGFRELSENFKERRKSRFSSTNSLDDNVAEEFMGNLDEGLKSLSW
ncbi:hypothetical protein CHS0354_022200 [Potamilus streckersoni]|uniref:EF-hand domain-containing protein n=1 Tax=Potamilus streckersoni TaxID=2493646 RepID=A0AAE0WD58_9BIVA|nr:hypothetical protein CHS0354_022200 [Potamilus streckersoni]